MAIKVRPESRDDRPGIRRINELAFGRSNKADLVDVLRHAADPLISLVALPEGESVGHQRMSMALTIDMSLVGSRPGKEAGIAVIIGIS